MITEVGISANVYMDFCLHNLQNGNIQAGFI